MREASREEKARNVRVKPYLHVLRTKRVLSASKFSLPFVDNRRGRRAVARGEADTENITILTDEVRKDREGDDQERRGEKEGSIV